jgi:pimeloyl-ACP methyl ester carboxylesterase
MPVTTIDEVKIHYNEAGEGEPLLLIMGYGMPGDAWLGSLPFLNGFRSIYYDNRAPGEATSQRDRTPSCRWPTTPPGCSTTSASRAPMCMAYRWAE